MDIRDKLTIAGALAVAALATAKLIADKEAKISDVRRDWISGFRDALSECLASAHIIAGRIVIRRRHQKGALSESDIKELETELTEHWVSYRHAFQKTLLHLNFSEAVLTLLPGYHGGKQDPAAHKRGPVSDEDAWHTLTEPRTHSTYYNHLHGLASPFPEMEQNPPARAAAAELGKTLVELRSALLGQYDKIGEGPAYDRIEDLIRKATRLGALAIEPETALISKGEWAHRLAIGGSIALVCIGVFEFFKS